jgi:hypothetical protein
MICLMEGFGLCRNFGSCYQSTVLGEEDLMPCRSGNAVTGAGVDKLKLFSLLLRKQKIQSKTSGSGSLKLLLENIIP